jgi:TAG lipase/steryl ester hydrolase/phospholipase A2/LPA acyltransferase
MLRRRRQLVRLLAALDEATSYAQWSAIAADIDHLSGLGPWRTDTAEPHLDAVGIREDIERLASYRDRGDFAAVLSRLTASIHRHQGDVTAPALFETALTGPPTLVEEWLSAVEASIRWMADAPGVPADEKLRLVQHAARLHGRSALLLSGGATLGFYHLGVVKALWQAGLLPEVLCGASMGAMVAAGIATRTDDELAALFEDPSDVRRVGLRLVGLSAMRSQGALLDPSVMLETVRHNVGYMTFQDAFERTGRVLNVSISPTRDRQKPRILNHLTAPDALICVAALASGAVPVAFPPVMLKALDTDGREVPYLPSERWIDGSMQGDLPKMRLSRLHNVNHFIVSQTNPHVLPFLHLRQQGGLLPMAATMAGKSLHAQSRQLLQVAAKVAEPTPLSGWVGIAQGLADQDYRGDIDLHPRFDLRLFRRVFSNPTRAELDRFILEGERATWPRLEMIRQHTRISRVFSEITAKLRARRGAGLRIVG